MNYLDFQYIQYFIFASVVLYFVFDFFDSKKVKDEREEFIKLKANELVQKATLFTIALLSIAYMLYPGMPAYIPLICIILCNLYSEIVGKIYFRNKY
ncbi:MAG: hypothetical protein ACXVAX_12725 [Pseudobdellovibrio sp.]